MLGKGTVHVRFSLFARIACVAAVAALLLPALGGAGMAADRGGSMQGSWYTGSYSDGPSDATGGNVYIDTGNDNAIRGGLVLDPGTGNANNNSVTITGGQVSDVAGGGAQSGNANNNRVTISGGSSSSVEGGYVAGGSGNAIGNTVTVSGGTIGTVYGGYAPNGSGSANNNTVTISGGTITGNVIGGQVGSGRAENNTVIYSGGTVGGLYGGYASGSGNTLISIGNRSVGLNVSHFQNYRFVLDANQNVGLTADGTFTMDTNNNEILGVDILGGANLPKEGDTLTLVKAGTLTPGADITAGFKGIGKKGVSVLFDYEVDPANTVANSLTATVTKVHGANPQAKSLLEGRIAGITTINQAGDMVAGKGIAAASAAVSSSGFGIYAATSGGTNRYKSGSHVDLDSISFMLGAGWRKNTGVGALLLSPFFEFGWGKYKAHNDNLGGFADVDAKGTTNYQGVGVLARYDHCSGFYGEGSFRLGRLHQSYDSSDLTDGAGRGSSYKYNQLYTSLHVGVGRTFALGMGELDVYGKYFWTRAGKKDITVRGDPISFAAANSHRMRLGARYTHAVSEAVKPYVGAGFEYEFAGKAKAKTYRIFDINSPRIKGGSGLLEAGIDYTPVGAKWAINAGATGYVGKRRGIMGQLGVRADF